MARIGEGGCERCYKGRQNSTGLISRHVQITLNKCVHSSRSIFIAVAEWGES